MDHQYQAHKKIRYRKLERLTARRYNNGCSYKTLGWVPKLLARENQLPHFTPEFSST